MDRDEFRHSIIAQQDSGGWDPRGYVCVRLPDGRYGISKFSHCSCFGTWTALGEEDMSFTWTGTEEELIQMAQKEWDIDAPFQRKIDPNDYDYEYLSDLYSDIRVKFYREDEK